ncbi:MAG: hypothetical protein DMF62_07885 [Acidobacteria bacterium]|nr:MAG: hypothetical protein DMF62_07885 [Acidobacteriota bacterium]
MPSPSPFPLPYPEPPPLPLPVPYPTPVPRPLPLPELFAGFFAFFPEAAPEDRTIKLEVLREFKGRFEIERPTIAVWRWERPPPPPPLLVTSTVSEAAPRVAFRSWPSGISTGT